MSIIQARFIIIYPSISQGLILFAYQQKNPPSLGVPENIFLVFNKIKIEIFLLAPKTSWAPGTVPAVPVEKSAMLYLGMWMRGTVRGVCVC